VISAAKKWHGGSVTKAMPLLVAITINGAGEMISIRENSMKTMKMEKISGEENDNEEKNVK